MTKQNAIILLLVRGVFLHVQFFSSYYGGGYSFNYNCFRWYYHMNIHNMWLLINGTLIFDIESSQKTPIQWLVTCRHPLIVVTMNLWPIWGEYFVCWICPPYDSYVTTNFNLSKDHVSTLFGSSPPLLRLEASLK